MNPKQTAALRDWLMEQIADCETRRTALCIERIKLDAAAEIREKFETIRREIL